MTRSMKIFLGIAGLLAAVAIVSYLTQGEELRLAMHRPVPRSPRRVPAVEQTAKPKQAEALEGKGAAVQVWVLRAPATCWDEAVALLREMSKKYPQQMYLEIHTMTKPEDREAAAKRGMECAGIQINGRSTVGVTMPDGTQRTLTLIKSPGYEYSLEDLRMALEQVLEKARKGGGGGKPAPS